MTLVQQRHFDNACEALLGHIAWAADPTKPEFAAYIGHRIEVAAFYAKYCLREARRLHLYPDTAQLERELAVAA